MTLVQEPSQQAIEETVEAGGRRVPVRRFGAASGGDRLGQRRERRPGLAGPDGIIRTSWPVTVGTGRRQRDFRR